MAGKLKISKSKDFELAPAGVALGLLYRVVDTGTQNRTYQGKTETYRSVIFSFELPENLGADGKPLMVQKSYRISMSEKSNLRKDLEAWRGKKYTNDDIEEFSRNGFDFTMLLGKAALLTIVHTEGETVYANISAVAPPMKGMAIPKTTVNERMTLILDPETFDRNAFSKLSEKMQEYIGKSPEYKAIMSGKPIENHQTDMDLDDEIPF